MHTTVSAEHYPVGRSIALGAIGGLVAGLVMVPLLMLTSIMAGLSANAVPFVLGLAVGADPDIALSVGLALFLMLSIIIGAIFGAVTVGVMRLRMTSYRKGIVEGIIAGIVAFAVLFVPLSVIVIPATVSTTIEDMGLGITPQQTVATLSQALPIILGMGFVGWVIFGAVMGAVTTALLQRTGARRVVAKENTSLTADEQHKGEPVANLAEFSCPRCGVRFESADLLDSHMIASHRDTAATAA